ncbi:c-type cytochrome [Litoreibacter janthinus]|uniref:Cytochrome c556 n=1 Tax=Litoreibacter janthinus TaxID=670154 RepID=A0A1I6H222_9RHOB|nr:cytochrome c [Litoreibacter janthinus]SFR48450.1 Cytochrome c556 [Litoreibacter janthinus]
MMLPKILATSGLAAVLMSGLAFADGHDALPAEVKARNGLMNNYALNLGILGNMAKGTSDYDANVAALAAANLAAFSATDQSLLWTANTDTMSIDGTRALPKIWEDRADFDAKGNDLAMAAKALADVAGTDLAALQGAMGSIGGACGACHKVYREPK